MNTFFSVQPKALVGGLTIHLYFHAGGIDLDIADVFQRMRWQRLLPCRRIEFRSLRSLPVVHQNVSKMVAPNAIAPTLDEDHARTAMHVDGSRPSGRNPRTQYTHSFVFKQESVIVGCGDQGVQRVPPWPRLFRCARRLRHHSLSHSLPLRVGVIPLGLGERTPGTSRWAGFRPGCGIRRQSKGYSRWSKEHRVLPPRKAHSPGFGGTCNLSRCAESHGT